MFYIIQIFPRKSHDQVHIDVVKAKFSCNVELFFYIFYCMTAADEIQGLLVHGLWVNRNTADAMGS